MNYKHSVKAKLSNQTQAIRNFGVKRLGLFGSVVNGELTSESDIDFLVEFEKGRKNFKNFMGLYFFLEDLFGRKIDLVTYESLSPYLAPYIIKEVEYIEELT